MRQRDGNAREKRRAPRRQCALHPLATDPNQCMDRHTRIVARQPAKPSRADWWGQMAKREHASEAQLEPRIHGNRRIVDEHDDRGDGEQRIAVPVASRDRSNGPGHRHQGGAHGAWCRRHHGKRDQRDDRHERRRHAVAARDARRRDTRQPPEHGKVEPRDRQDVRQTDHAEGPFDRRVPVLRVAKDERDQHASDSVRSIIGNSRDDSITDSPAQFGSHAKPRALEHANASGWFDNADQRSRLDRDRADERTRWPRSHTRKRPRRHRRRSQPSDHTHPIARSHGRRIIRSRRSH